MEFGLTVDKISLGIIIMKKFFRKFKKNNTENSYAEIKVREYICKYLKELQRHFDLSDKRMRIILRRICKDSGNFNIFIKFMKKKLSVLKSRCTRMKEL